jgi:hypothetical protein
MIQMLENERLPGNGEEAMPSTSTSRLSNGTAIDSSRDAPGFSAEERPRRSLGAAGRGGTRPGAGVGRSLLGQQTKGLNALPTDVGSRVGVMYNIRGDSAELHFIFNGEDFGVYAKTIPYKRGPLFAVADIYGTTKQVRIVQLYGVSTLQSACREAILERLSTPEDVSSLPLPKKLQNYLLCHR